MRRWIAGVLLASALPATAADLEPGDVVLSDRLGAALFAFRPGDGSLEVISSADVGDGPALAAPVDIALGPDSLLYVADQEAGIFQVDPVSGVRRLLVPHGQDPELDLEYSRMWAVDVDGEGRVLFYDNGVVDRQIVRLDPGDDSRLLVWTVHDTGNVSRPRDFDVAASGSLFIADNDDRVKRLEQDGSNQLVSGAPLTAGRLEDLVYDRNHNLWALTGAGGEGITRARPVLVLGRIVWVFDRVVTSADKGAGPLFTSPRSLSMESGAFWLTAEEGLFRVDTVSGDREIRLPAVAGESDLHGVRVLESAPMPDDSDGDGVAEAVDVCPGLFDPGQEDRDGNRVGDACNDFEDRDGDEFADGLDTCPDLPDPEQADADRDGVGDLCNDALDRDGDEFRDSRDNCPDAANPDQTDSNLSGAGDACDPVGPALLDGSLSIEQTLMAELGIPRDEACRTYSSPEFRTTGPCQVEGDLSARIPLVTPVSTHSYGEVSVGVGVHSMRAEADVFRRLLVPDHRAGIVGGSTSVDVSLKDSPEAPERTRAEGSTALGDLYAFTVPQLGPDEKFQMRHEMRVAGDPGNSFSGDPGSLEVRLPGSGVTISSLTAPYPEQRLDLSSYAGQRIEAEFTASPRLAAPRYFGGILSQRLDFLFSLLHFRPPPPRMLVWIEGGFGPGELYVGSLDEPEEHARRLSEDRNLTDVVFDPVESRLYGASNGAIFRSDLDGESFEILVSHGVGFSEGVAFDVEERRLYWASWRGQIWSSEPDGSDATLLYETDQRLYGLALDPDGWIYFSARDALIRAMRRDGSDVRVLFDGGEEPLGIAFDPESERIYWADWEGGGVNSAFIDGSGRWRLQRPGNPIDVTLDVERGLMVWSEWFPNALYRANLDGSDRQLLLYRPRQPWGVVITPDEREPRVCDVDGNFEVDIADVDAIFAARGEPADAGDPRDPDGDGWITVGDGRLCALECANPQCEPSAAPAVPAAATVAAQETEPPSKHDALRNAGGSPSCGLLGAEPLLLLAWLQRRRQRALQPPPRAARRRRCASRATR